MKNKQLKNKIINKLGLKKKFVKTKMHNIYYNSEFFMMLYTKKEIRRMKGINKI